MATSGSQGPLLPIGWTVVMQLSFNTTKKDYCPFNSKYEAIRGL
jgi:hypothetical protein